jgi:hypothetical protein
MGPATPGRGDAFGRVQAREEGEQRPAEPTAARLQAPRADAIAGILFSVLLITSFTLLRRSVPADPLEAGAWLKTRANTVALALNLVPFGGIAFLWFIGVLRDRLGAREDRFCATVFLGSGLLFLAMLFFSAAVAGGIIIAFAASPDLLGSTTFTFARDHLRDREHLCDPDGGRVHDRHLHACAAHRIIARWLALLGYALAIVLLFSSRSMDGIMLLFPLWVL